LRAEQRHRDARRLGSRQRAICVEPGRERQRRHAAQRALARSGDGAAVKHVVAQIGAVVESRKHQIGAARQDAGAREERGVNAVGGRAVHRKHPLTMLEQPKRSMQAERVARGALLGLGRAHDYVRVRQERSAQCVQPLRAKAVIVREQD
jgi:hypothetical protein